jgi:hypothetical protein
MEGASQRCAPMSMATSLPLSRSVPRRAFSQDGAFLATYMVMAARVKGSGISFPTFEVASRLHPGPQLGFPKKLLGRSGHEYYGDAD